MLTVNVPPRVCLTQACRRDKVCLANPGDGVGTRGERAHPTVPCDPLAAPLALDCADMQVLSFPSYESKHPSV